MKKIDIVTGDVPFFKRLFQRKKQDKEIEELKKVWMLLDMASPPPKVYTAGKFKKYLYPAFALGLLGLLIGIYFGMKYEPYSEYISIAQEVINYGE